MLIIGWLFIRFVIGGNEDSWVKDEKGIWVKHGNPSETLNYVKEQKDIIAKALELYELRKTEGVEFSSQCIGTCENYAIDIVYVPRISEDNLIENQCSDYNDGKVSQFIELDKYGNIVRVI